MVNALNDALYGVASRDRYRTRIERGAEPGTTEIYISHRGAEQMVVGDETQDAKREGLGERVWQPRPNDSGLEAEMLSRLMIFLGADEQRADALVAGDATPDPRARLVREDGSAVALTLDEVFLRAWRRTSLALDRAGFTVEDRDRSRGLFFVRYVDRGADAQSEKTGWLSRLKFWGNDDGAEQDDDAYLSPPERGSAGHDPGRGARPGTESVKRARPRIESSPCFTSSSSRPARISGRQSGFAPASHLPTHLRC